MNENSAYLFDVETPKEWIFTGEPTWISGWFLTKVGAVFSDIRAVIDDVPYLGLLGMPREHVELKHRGYAGLPHAGFILQIAPPRGARLLRLELLDAGHRWVEIWRTPIEVRRGPRPGATLDAELVAPILEQLLQAQRADPAGDLAAAAAPLVAAAGAVPLDTLPNPPFYGALENPRRVGGTQFGKLRLEGWIIHLQQRITRLIATTHPLVENVMAYGDRPRPEAGEMFPHHPYAAKSQFFGMADVDERVPNPVALKIFAELEDGSRHLVFARRFYQRTCADQERPLPALDQWTLLRAVRALRRAGRDQHIRHGSLRALGRGVQSAWSEYQRKAPASLAHLARSPVEPYAAWQEANRLTPRLRRAMEASAAALAGGGPRFTLLVDAVDGAAGLDDLLASLRAQIYPHWEAWIAAPGAPPAACAGEARCRHEPCAGPADRVRALNAAAHQSAGTHLALLAAGARLPADALLQVAERLAAAPALELVYTDEDRMDDAGTRTDPDFKPEWSPALALSGRFPGDLAVVRRDRFVELGSFREAYAAVPAYDLLLRLGDRLRPEQVAHVPSIGHHARGAPAAIDPADPAVEQARLALADALRRRAGAAEPFLPEVSHERKLRWHQLQWDPKILSRLQVTIVIPTRDRLHLLQECIELLDETVDWRYVKLLIVDDTSRDPDAVRYLEAIPRRTDLLCSVVRPEDPRAPFNYSHLINRAMAAVDTPLALQLNNDVNALARGWLEELAGWFTLPDVGVVGAQLLYPDKTLNHSGIVLGAHGGLADTPFLRRPPRDVAAVEWHALAREASAVTGACLLTRTALFRELGGFDERDFGVAYNDVDYCARVRAAGRRVIYTPQAKLMHWGSATRGVTFDEAEHIAFVRKYTRPRDPFCSPHLELAEDHAVRCRGAVCGHTARAGALRLLLITHNLNLEGSPLFLLEYATWLVREAGWHLEVVACADGPLRGAFEALGVPITLVDRHRIYSAETEAQFAERVAEVRARLPLDRIDLVVCNTLVNFWGVHLARQAGKPALFYIHESTSIFRFFEKMLPLPLHRLVGQAFREAARALFLCRATRAYYEDYNVNDNFRLVSSWIRIDDIEAFRAGHDRVELRRQHGFRDDEVVIANIGTVCERKGQHVFIRAVDHFNHHHAGRAPVRFVLVGARPGIYLDLLTADIARLGLPNLTLVPETRAAFDFFQLSDLFVCTSYEESFPRVVLEAMAFRTPIVTTDVHGIPEMVRQRAEAYLVAPGDVEGLSRMMRTCLAKERSGKSLTPTAYSKALRFYDYRKVLPDHAELAREAFLAGD